MAGNRRGWYKPVIPFGMNRYLPTKDRLRIGTARAFGNPFTNARYNQSRYRANFKRQQYAARLVRAVRAREARRQYAIRSLGIRYAMRARGNRR